MTPMQPNSDPHARILRALNARGVSPQRAAQAARRYIKRTYGVEHGLEYLKLPTGESIAYVIRGGTYDETLVSTGDGWIISSWGGEYDASKRKRREEAGEAHCPNCGDWYETAGDGDIRVTLCPHCGYAD